MAILNEDQATGRANTLAVTEAAFKDMFQVQTALGISL